MQVDITQTPLAQNSYNTSKKLIFIETKSFPLHLKLYNESTHESMSMPDPFSVQKGKGSSVQDQGWDRVRLFLLVLLQDTHN